jgi:uncharacterized protein YecT (DUF1311 family)
LKSCVRHISIIVVALASSSVLAAQASIDCSRGGNTQLEMNTCAGRAAEAASAKLARLVKELEPKLDPQARDEFRNIQAQWNEYRHRDCNWERDMFGRGSVAPMVYGYCSAARTSERIERLKILLCEGAGVTGPCEASRKY